jgi:hypothetical protein
MSGGAVGFADREFYSTFCFAKRWSQKATTIKAPGPRTRKPTALSA